jgi:predicted regulator of Ras-like GTPase activity (Roadblock/LC7/MglB family)
VWEEQNPQKALSWVLGRLMERLQGVKEAAVADAHGLTLATGSQGRRRGEASAVGALITQSSKEFFKGLGILGDPQWVVLEGEAATVVASPVPGGEESLIVVLESGADIPRTKVEMQKVLIYVREILDRM